MNIIVPCDVFIMVNKYENINKGNLKLLYGKQDLILKIWTIINAYWQIPDVYIFTKLYSLLQKKPLEFETRPPSSF